MKTILLFGFLFIFVIPVYGELNTQDLDKIRLIVKEEISMFKTEFKSEIANSEKRIKDYVDTKFEAVDTKFEAVNTKFEAVDTKFEALQKQINLLVAFISGLIIITVATIGIPQTIMAWRGRNERSQDEKIEALSREIEVLKEQLIVNSKTT